MKKCFICGGKARIFTGEEWVCEDCYLKLRKKNEGEQPAMKLKPSVHKNKYIDLNLRQI